MNAKSGVGAVKKTENHNKVKKNSVRDDKKSEEKC